MDIHLSPRQIGIMRFALAYVQANLDDINEDLLEEGGSIYFEGHLLDGEITLFRANLEETNAGQVTFPYKEKPFKG